MTNINNLKHCDARVKTLLTTISNPKFKLNFLTTDIKSSFTVN